MKRVIDRTDDMSQKRLRSVLKTCGIIIALGLVYLFVFRTIGVGIPCVFRVVTGLKCPGCGMTHAMAALASGDVNGAAENNILSVTVVPMLLIYGFYKAVRYIKTGEEEFGIGEIIFLLLCMIACVFYFIYRNGLIYHLRNLRSLGYS
jgi:hypothetical protein